MNRGEGIHHLDKKSVSPRLTCLPVQHEDYKSPMPPARVPRIALHRDLSNLRKARSRDEHRIPDRKDCFGRVLVGGAA